MTNAESAQDLKEFSLSDGDLQTLMRAGVHIGHSHSKTHPAMRPFIYATRNGIEIIDVLKSAEYLEKASAFLRSVVAKGGTILWVGTKPSARIAVEAAAKQTIMPYVTNRWVGGLLTNYRVISKQVAEMETIEKDKASGALEKYTKQERSRIDRKHNSLLKAYDGIRDLKRLPEAVIIIETVHDQLAVKEAIRMKIPMVTLADSNADPRVMQYPIPSNDDARLAVEYMVTKLAQAILDGKEEAKKASAIAAELAAAKEIKDKEEKESFNKDER